MQSPWTAEFTDTTMTLAGTLTTTDLKRILSLFAFPNPAGESDPMVKGNAPSAAATKRYLQAVDVILADIARTKGTGNYEKTATWHDKAAEQIMQLNHCNVDPVATKAAAQAATRVRAIGQSLRGVPIDTKALESQAYYSASGGRSVGWWGMRAHVVNNPVYVETNVPEIRKQIAKVGADNELRRAETWGRSTGC